MPSQLDHPDEYELVSRESSDEDFDLNDEDFQSTGLTATSYAKARQSRPQWQSILARFNPLRSRRGPSKSNRRLRTSRQRRSSNPARRSTRRFPRPSKRCFFLFHGLLGVLFAIVLLTAIFRPSYTNPPSHYHELRQRVKSSKDYGRANPDNQKIFIAASLYDKGGHLLRGPWGNAVLELLDILGNKNVYLSIYENEIDEGAQVASYQFDKKVQCPHSVVYDREFQLDEVPTVIMPDGFARTKRIAYLAEMRNKALLPLEESSAIKYDKLLFLNDVVFDPIDAAQLLLSTNLNSEGRTSYRAACAVDFMNPFKFYDTFATRDVEGYSMGLPFFPWFTNAGKGYSRQDVLDGKDAVRVKSCWGGMVAFDARPFQAQKPLRFRATEDLYWDASECCLVHADLAKSASIEDVDAPGIYINPFVRVAYGTGTLRWLPITKRFERLYSIIHNLVDHLVGMPWKNPRRSEQEGDKVEDKVWMPDKDKEGGGSYRMQTRTAAGDGFCGIRMLQLLKKTPREGERNWEMMPVPSQ